MNECDATIVTVCDQNFIWGAWLLVASLRCHNVNLPIRILAKNISAQDRELLLQFPNVTLYEIPSNDPQGAHLLKPQAILGASTQLVTWMDSDCIVSGNISPYIYATGESLQLRFRNREENAQLFSSRSGPHDEYGAIPSSVLDIWRRDVADRQNAAIQTTMTSCCFTIHRKFFPFIELWQTQMKKVLPRHDGVMCPHSPAYFMTDESVFNSLLAFSSIAPKTTDYLLDKDPRALLIHFVSRPKPWQFWIQQHIKWYDVTLHIIDWAIKQGFQTPLMPWSLKRCYKPLCIVLARARQALARAKYFIKTKIA